MENKIIDLTAMKQSDENYFKYFIENGNNFIEKILAEENTVVNIPPELFLRSFPSKKYVNKLVGISGTIIKTNSEKIRNIKKVRFCLTCDSTDMEVLKGICSTCKNRVQYRQSFLDAKKFQVIRLQNLKYSKNTLETIEVHIPHFLLNKYKTGENISVFGLFKLELKNKNSEFLRGFIEAIQISETSAEENFQKLKLENKSVFDRQVQLIEKFSQEIYQYSFLKLGLLIAIFGGDKKSKNLNKKRKNSHVLIVGPTATAKTRLLRSIKHGIYINGYNTTEAGLTVCASRANGEWQLESGALLLANQKSCLIDNFDFVSKNEKASLLEAMEQQSITIAKAGLVSTFNINLSIVAAISDRQNKMSTDRSIENLNRSFNLIPPLISRFDLIFYLEEILNEKIALHILNLEKLQERNFLLENENSIEIIFEDKYLKILTIYYKKYLEPVDNNIRIMEGLVRLVLSHAQILNMEKITEFNIFTVIFLMERTIRRSGLIDFTDKVFLDEKYFYAKVRELKKFF